MGCKRGEIGVRKRVLVMEDDQRILEIFAFALGREGYQIIRASDGVFGLRLAEEWEPHLAVIDLAHTEPNSIETCQELRLAGCEIPVILLVSTEKREEDVALLNAEYLQKPFQMQELLMRIRANTWELDFAGMGSVARWVFDRIVIDREQVLVTKDDLPVELTQREYDLLCYLAQEPGRVVTREELLEKVWGYSYMGDSRNVDVCIRRLREKLEDNPSHPSVIVTRRGCGYAFAR